MRRQRLYLSLFFMAGCSAQSGRPTCSTVKSVITTSESLKKEIQSNKQKTSWGGLFDLLENPDSPDTSARSRCTMLMDYLPVADGQTADPLEIAFWTADHCLNFSSAQGAELQLFDPKRRKFLRFNILLESLEKYKEGLKLFQERAAANNAGDTGAQDDLNAFKESAKRVSVLHNGAPLIERGGSTCIADTAAYVAANPSKTTVCSTTSDLAQVRARVQLSGTGDAEITEALTRMAADLKKEDADRIKMAEAKIPDVGVLQKGFKFFLKSWRKRVAAMTTFRTYESQSALAEKVSQCATGDLSGICAQSFRDYFKPAIDAYKTWVKNDAAGSVRNFPTALHDHVYREPDPADLDTYNLKWILKVNSEIKNAAHLWPETSVSTNVLRPGYKVPTEVPPPTVGESGPLYFVLARVIQVNPQLNPDNVLAGLLFKDKSILIPYSRTAKPLSLGFQPGDSGSLLVVTGLPVGVVSTVDGKETSGGASIRPLPEYVGEEESSDANNAALSKNAALTTCK